MQQGKAEEVSEEMSHLNEYTYPQMYHIGRASREAGDPNRPPSTATWSDSHWFKAGWNDRDIELKPQ